MKAINQFLNHWQDSASKERVLRTDKGKDLQKADVENYLKNMAMRFQQSPNPNTLQLWASDIIDAGYNELMVKEVCKTIPYKFERHPTLAQIMELLRPYIAQVDVFESDFDKYTRLATPHLKAKLVNMVGQDGYDRLLSYYRANVFDTDLPIEICVLGDWCRCYLGRPEKIIEQGRISNQMALESNIEYFTRPLKMYCEQNKLV